MCLAARLLADGPCCRLCILQRCFTVQRFRPKPAGRNVIPIEVLAGAVVGEADLKATAPGDGLMFDYADTIVAAGAPAVVFVSADGQTWLKQ